MANSQYFADPRHGHVALLVQSFGSAEFVGGGGTGLPPGKRSNLGQHYTSVPNILKTIEPLFMDELKEKFDNAYNSVPQLEKLLDRIGKIKIFDPAIMRKLSVSRDTWHLVA